MDPTYEEYLTEFATTVKELLHSFADRQLVVDYLKNINVAGEVFSRKYGQMMQQIDSLCKQCSDRASMMQRLVASQSGKLHEECPFLGKMVMEFVNRFGPLKTFKNSYFAETFAANLKLFQRVIEDVGRVAPEMFKHQLNALFVALYFELQQRTLDYLCFFVDVECEFYETIIRTTIQKAQGLDLKQKYTFYPPKGLVAKDMSHGYVVRVLNALEGMERRIAAFYFVTFMGKRPINGVEIVRAIKGNRETLRSFSAMFEAFKERARNALLEPAYCNGPEVGVQYEMDLLLSFERLVQNTFTMESTGQILKFGYADAYLAEDPRLKKKDYAVEPLLRQCEPPEFDLLPQKAHTSFAMPPPKPMLAIRVDPRIAAAGQEAEIARPIHTAPNPGAMGPIQMPSQYL